MKNGTNSDHRFEFTDENETVRDRTEQEVGNSRAAERAAEVVLAVICWRRLGCARLPDSTHTLTLSLVGRGDFRGCTQVMALRGGTGRVRHRCFHPGREDRRPVLRQR